MNRQQSSWLALASLMFATVHAEDNYGRSAVLSVQGDETGNRQWLGQHAWSLGERAWLQGSLGKSELGTASTNIVGAAFGMNAQSLNATVEYVQRKGDSEFEQQNWAATLEWRGVRGGVGADGFLRSARGESTSTQQGGVLASPVTTVTRESLHAKGVGLHGDFALTERVAVFAGAMRYRYEIDRNSEARSSSSPLSTLLGLNSALAGAWRDQALIDRTYRVGGSYSLSNAILSAQYFSDRLADGDGRVDTVQLQSEFAVGRQWVVAPSIAYSSGGSLGHVGSGGLSLRLRY